MDDGSQKVLDQLAEGLQALQAYDAPLRADPFEYLGNLHSHVLLVEGKDEFAQLFLRWHYLFFGFVRDLRMEYDILDALEE